ncbi:MAG TPA: hypothetical protein VFB17_05415 [Gaiellaceae bacterium]|nr:hypothetical protein [Gaiellaceae bacterium]
MRRLTIEAASLASARGFVAALEGFPVELHRTEDGEYVVLVRMRSDRDVVPILRALEQHAETRELNRHRR